MKRSIAGLRRRFLILATLLLTFSGYSTIHAGATTISTTVKTSLPVFEFNGYFGPAKPTIDCEIDHHFSLGSGRFLSSAYCMTSTSSRTQNVRLSPSGRIRICTGVACGSNPGLGTPTFAPGTKVVSGPFTCVIGNSSVTCRNHKGRGFVITPSRITRQ